MKKLIISLGCIYIGVCSGMYFLQDNLLFFPRTNAAASVEALRGSEWRFDTADASLTGWFIERDNATQLPLVIYFGGNAQDIARRSVDFANGQAANANVLLVNYRGYGTSTGSPGERELFADALNIYDQARTRTTHNGKFVAWGRSLGSGVAVYLAQNRPIDAVILVTPYDSVTAVAQSRYPFLPVAWLLHHPFDSASRAPMLHLPALVFIAGQDRIVPPKHAEDLVTIWGGDKEVHRYADAGHGNLPRDARFDPTVNDFLRRLQ